MSKLARIRPSFVAAFLSVCFCGTPSLFADETDQFLTWGVELSDSSSLLNTYLARKIQVVLDEKNQEADDDCSCEDITQDVFSDIYLDRFRADLFDFIQENDEIELYPSRKLSHSDIMDRSIYKDVRLPYIIRVAPSIRIGDVYLGTDKLAHLFGFGRRYYVRFLRDKGDGIEDDEAEENAITWGIFTENTFLGKSITGIFSSADLEGNYQGLRLARDFCEGEDAYIRHDGDRWTLGRAIDLREYVTSAFDESYYSSLYASDVLSAVLPRLGDVYAEKAGLPSVRERFESYSCSEPSRSMKIVEYYLREKGVPSQGKKLKKALAVDSSQPVVPLDPTAIAPKRRETPCD